MQKWLAWSFVMIQSCKYFTYLKNALKITFAVIQWDLGTHREDVNPNWEQCIFVQNIYSISKLQGCYKCMHMKSEILDTLRGRRSFIYFNFIKCCSDVISKYGFIFHLFVLVWNITHIHLHRFVSILITLTYWSSKCIQLVNQSTCTRAKIHWFFFVLRVKW